MKGDDESEFVCLLIMQMTEGRVTDIFIFLKPVLYFVDGRVTVIVQNQAIYFRYIDLASFYIIRETLNKYRFEALH